MNARKTIRELCKSFDPSSYENIDLNRLALYAIWFLEENSVPNTFENIAVASYLMFPEKFSLVGYEEYPDTARINRTLLQLRPKYRNWATGNVQRGYTLTSMGKTVVKQTKELLRNPGLQSRRSEPNKPRTRSLELEMERIIHSSVFQKFLEDERDEISRIEVWELLKAAPHTPPKVMREYIRRLQNDARESSHPESEKIVDFLNWIQRRYRNALTN
jgi:hypothetical protein